ncbi:MAG: hypothetical protein A2X93_07940 [Deltaproteobacteria bacterium GWC2_56_8]|nr:MAG: hypothetical protein A2X93_07940 [Deltaproteobacteria bacterium GWC2_56_8]
MELGRYLQEQRKAQKKTLKDMSASSGVSQPYLCDFEKGAFLRPNYDKLTLIAKGYKVPLDLLLKTFYGENLIDEELEIKLKEVLSDSKLSANTRKMAAAEKKGDATKKLIVELYEKLKK